VTQGIRVAIFRPCFANKGKKTLLIEKQAIGGTCINRGCTPTKTMVASSKAAFQARRMDLFGVQGVFHSMDMKKVTDRKDSLVASFRNSSQKRMEETLHLDLFFGKAHFIDSHTLEISNNNHTETIKGDVIVVNTGGRPMIPRLKGIESIPYLDSTTIMELNEVPKHLIVIGGGYISLEFSQMFRRFGSKITVIQRSERLLKKEDPDLVEELKKILVEDGIEFLFNASIQEISKENQQLTVRVSTPEDESLLEGSHLLVAAGRVPNTEDLNLSAAGIEVDERGFIPVNDHLQTKIPHIYAIGDVKGGPAFTHISYDDFRILRDNLFEESKRTTKDRLVPYTIFTDPQFGRVGLSEEEAKKANIPYKVAKMPMNYVARALEIDEDRGLMKIIVHEKTSEILGCGILGVEGGEIMSMIEIAMMGKLPYQMLQNAIFAHPTLAESLNNLFNHFSGGT